MSQAGRPAVTSPAPRSRWIDLRTRLISAAVLAPIGVACMWSGGVAWIFLVAVAAFGLAAEWVHLCGRRLLSPAGAAVPLAVCCAGAAAVAASAWVALVVLAVGAGLVRLLGQRLLAAGVLYVGPAVVALLWLRADPAAGRANVLFVLLIVWASDIGAYVAGRVVGGPLLAPSISPAKTWSGAAGGLLAAALTGLLLAWGFTGPPGARPALLAAALGVVAQLGDLLESRLKRRFGVKDSSRLIPGHGGLLDRLDAVLTAAPAAGLLALLLGRGVMLWS